MTFPPSIRLFFAIEIPVEGQKVLADQIDLFKNHTRSRAIRWTKPENLHITLQFLAAFPSAHLTTLIEMVTTSLAGSALSEGISLGPLYLFPNAYRPRVIALDVKPQALLMNLSQRIGQAILSTGSPMEERAFHAHLTLGRLKQVNAWDVRRLLQVKVSPMSLIPIREVVLFRSQPGVDGSHYHALARFSLAVNRLKSV